MIIKVLPQDRQVPRTEPYTFDFFKVTVLQNLGLSFLIVETNLLLPSRLIEIESSIKIWLVKPLKR